MLMATNNRRIGVYANDVKRIFLDSCLSCSCNRDVIIYAIEDVDRVISRMPRGDVLLWILCKNHTHTLYGRVVDTNALRTLSEMESIIKLYRVERMTADYDVVELKLNL